MRTGVPGGSGRGGPLAGGPRREAICAGSLGPARAALQLHREGERVVFIEYP